MRINIMQFGIVWEDHAANRKIVNDLASSASLQPESWLILPEMSLTGFSMDYKKTVIEGDDWKFFKELASTHKIFITMGCAINGFNRMITINPEGETINDYSKLHLFSYSGEDKHYSKGNFIDDAYKSFHIGDLNIVPAICYDLRFSYLFWPYAKNTDVYVVIANWPATRRDNWKTLLKARAVENQAYMIGVNRTGSGNNIEYSGDSLIIDPYGNEILNCENKEGVFQAEILKSEVEEARSKFPFIRDRII